MSNNLSNVTYFVGEMYLGNLITYLMMGIFKSIQVQIMKSIYNIYFNKWKNYYSKTKTCIF